MPSPDNAERWRRASGNPVRRPTSPYVTAMIGDDRLDGLVGIVLYLAAYAAGIGAHEAGHLLVAQLLGLQPRMFVVGRGPTLLRRRPGRVWLILRAVPLGGIVLMPDWVGRPLARALFFAAGPATNLALLGLCAVAASIPSPFVVEFAVAAGIAQAVILVVALWPTHVRVQGRLFPTDGLQLVRLATGRVTDELGPAHASLLKPFLAPGAPLPPASRHLPEIAFQVGRADRFREAWATSDAQDAMRALLVVPDLPAEERAFVLTFLVGNELCLGPLGTSLDELDAWSTEAMNRVPTPHVRVQRGGVLVALGSPEAARDELRAVLAVDLMPVDRLLAQAFLGQAEAALGAGEEAHRLFAAARALPLATTGVMPGILDRLERAAATRVPAGAARSGVPRISR